MTGKHTPGPWVVLIDHLGENEIEIVSNAGSHSVPVADIMLDKHTTFAPSLAEAMANAHLIAAAPDLLAVAKWLEANRHECFIPNPGDVFDEMLFAAIAKAEGRE